jgi:hypothetical protein
MVAVMVTYPYHDENPAVGAQASDSDEVGSHTQSNPDLPPQNPASATTYGERVCQPAVEKRHSTVQVTCTRRVGESRQPRLQDPPTNQQNTKIGRFY